VPGNGDVPVLNSVGNRMDMPRRVAADLNRFSRPLLGTLGPQGEHPMTVPGVANGSFAANGNDKTAGDYRYFLLRIPVIAPSTRQAASLVPDALDRSILTEVSIYSPELSLETTARLGILDYDKSSKRRSGGRQPIAE